MKIRKYDIMLRTVKLICLLFSAAAECQQLNYIRYSSDNSHMPHDVCYHLHQDKTGYIWIFTDDGMVRFDGTEMKKYSNGLKSNFTIDGDDWKDTLWVATWKGGIHYLYSDTAHYFPILAENAHGFDMTFNTNGIRRFGNFLFSYHFKYCTPFYLYKTGPKVFSFKESLKNLQAYTPGDSLNFLKIGEEKLLAFNHKAVFQLKDTQLIKIFSKGIDAINYKAGLLYFALRDSIFSCRMDFTGISFYCAIPSQNLKGKRITDLHITNSGNICLGYEDINFLWKAPSHYLLNRRSGEMTDLLKALKSKVVETGFLLDRDGSIWLATDGEGVYHVFEAGYRKIMSEISEVPYVTKLFLDRKNRFFIGTKRGAFMLESPASNKVKMISQANDPYYVHNFFEDENGEIQMNSRFQHQLNKLLKKDKTIDINSRKLILRTRNFTYIKNPDYSHFIVYKGKSFTANLGYGNADAKEDLQGRLFVASSFGLFRVSIQGDTPLVERFLTQVASTGLAFYQDKLWIATVNGLYYLEKNNAPGRFNSNILPDGIQVTSLLVSSNNKLCIGTPYGLFVYDGRNMSLIKKRDGLAGDDITSMVEWNGYLITGGIRGITYIPVTDLQPKPQNAVLLIERIFVNDEPKPSIINSSYPANTSFRVEFNSLNFTYPENVRYAYRLHDNEKWIETPTKSIVLSNLSHGDYKLQIRSRNIASDWGAAVSFPFRISAPWFRSLWFFVLLSLLAGAVLFIVFYYRNRSRNKKIETELQLSELRLMALQSQFNPHFISNSLNAMQYFFLRGDTMAVNKYMTQFADLTRYFLDSSEKRFQSLSHELDIINKYLEIEKLRFFDKFDYQVRVADNIDVSKDLVPAMLLQPIIENSINHGLVFLYDRKGLLLVDVSKTDDGTLQIIIDDNGIGRDASRELRKGRPKMHNSRSGQIIEEIQQIVNKIQKHRLDIVVTDKFENNKAAGTRVEIIFKY